MRRSLIVLRTAMLLILWPNPLAQAAPFVSALGVSGDVGLGGLGGQIHATVQSGLDIREGQLSLGLFGRVRLPLHDLDSSGYVRGRDWDEASDYVHILRYVHYSHTFGTVKLQAKEGELLSFTLGHGTLVRDYCNIADPDHPHSGIHLQLTSERLGVAAMVDNLVNPSLVTGRFTLRPTLAAPALVVGSSVVVDPRAPLAVRRDALGDRQMDQAYNLRTDNEVLVLLGLDVEYSLGNALARVTPYFDLNSSIEGVGAHLGATGQVALGDSGLALGAQAEYRAASDRYSPAYVETFYDLERYQASLSAADPAALPAGYADPKLAALRAGRYRGQGALAQLGLDYERLIQLKVGFSHRPGPDGEAIWLRGASSVGQRLDLGLLLVARGLGQRGASANGLMAMAEARYRLTNHLFTLGQYTRTWSLHEDTGYFDILQSFNISLGATWSG